MQTQLSSYTLPKTLNEMVRRTALRAGYQGVDHEATGGTAEIIRDAITSAHAELTRKRAISFPIDEHPDEYVTALLRFYRNEALADLDSSRPMVEYQAERIEALRDIRRVSAPLRDTVETTTDPDTGQVTTITTNIVTGYVTTVVTDEQGVELSSVTVAPEAETVLRHI